MAKKTEKISTYVRLTPKQKELLNELVNSSGKGQSEIMGHLIENYHESYKRKFC